MTVTASRIRTSAQPALATADRVAALVAGSAAVSLVPWTLHLGNTLHHPGFWIAVDSLEALSAGATAVLIVRRSGWAPFAARIGSVVLLWDAATDISSAHPMGRLAEALAMAVLVELPLAAAAWTWASRRNSALSTVKVGVKR